MCGEWQGFSAGQWCSHIGSNCWSAPAIAPDGVTICEPPDWLAETTITVQEGIQMMTTGAAFSIFREEEVGSLESGKFADLIVVSSHPLSVDPNDIKDIKVLLTMVGGKVEYCIL